MGVHPDIDTAVQAAMNGVYPAGGRWSVTPAESGPDGLEVACGLTDVYRPVSKCGATMTIAEFDAAANTDVMLSYHAPASVVGPRLQPRPVYHGLSARIGSKPVTHWQRQDDDGAYRHVVYPLGTGRNGRDTTGPVVA